MTRSLRSGGRASATCLLGALLTASALVGPLRPAAAAGARPESTGSTTRASVRTGGAQIDALGPATAGAGAVSDDGHSVAFTSDASNLVPGDTNGVTDVFVTQNGVIKRASLGTDFAQGDGPASTPALSGDGRFVAFVSEATNLVPGDTNDAADVFVYDRQLSTVERVSVAGDGAAADGPSGAPSIDNAGTAIVFTSAATNLVPGDTNGALDVFVRTRGANPQTALVSAADGGAGPGAGPSGEPSIAAAGTKVAFTSAAADLVAGDTNGRSDVFRRDLATGKTERISVADAGTGQGTGDSFSPSISDDGELVAFASDATNLTGGSDDNDATDVFLRRPGQRTILISQCSGTAGDHESTDPHITPGAAGSGSGAGVVFVSAAANLLEGCAAPAVPPDNNGVADVYFRPINASPTVNERVSRDGAGAQFTRASLGSAASVDGRVVAFAVGGEVFGRDRGAIPQKTSRLSDPPAGPALGPAATEFPVISADGGTVAFVSAAPDLVTDDSNGVSDVFVHDRLSRSTSRVSLGVGGADGAQSNGGSGVDSPPAVSADGAVVAFSSSASNLVTGDTNNLDDVFVYDRQAKRTTRVSVGPGGAEAGGESYSPSLSADGRFVAFASEAANLVPGDTNNATDVFVFDRRNATPTRVSLSNSGAQGDVFSASPSLSGDGTVVAFTSLAHLALGDTNDVADVFIRDLTAGTTTLVTGAGGAVGDAASSAPALSADGRVVVFSSAAANLVPGDTNHAADVFAFDRAHPKALALVSVGPSGAGGNRDSAGATVSGDGRFVAFASDATDLVPGDTNRRTDVFVRDRTLGLTARLSVGAPSGQADRDSATPSISASGRFVAFASDATNLLAGNLLAVDQRLDTNAAPDVFVHDRTPVRGYALVASDGGVFAFGDAGFFGSTGDRRLARPIVGLAATPSGKGYWLVASDGGVFAFGDAGFFGSTGDRRLARPIVGLAPTPSGKGYWLVASDGGVFAFGDAGFAGSAGNIKLTQPIVGMAATPSGRGYWLVARDGGIFAFGDAPFAGSAGAIRLAQPIVGMGATPSGGGYWLAGSDGGIFAFGDAAFAGSLGALTLNRPIVGLSPTPSGAGYWLVAGDGGIFAFGDAAFAGSTGAMKLTRPVVGMAPSLG